MWSKRLPAIAGCIGASLWLASGAVVTAQPAEQAVVAADAGSAAEVRARGQALMADGRPSAAERVYLEALRATGSPLWLTEISAARLAAGDGPGAAEALERFLDAVSEGEEADAARRRLAEIERMPSSLLVASTPRGAEVRIDGRVVGRTPVTAELAAGEHRLEVALEGHVESSEEVVLAFASRRTLAFELEPLPPPPADEAEWSPKPESSEAAPVVWALASVSAAALVVGTVFGFMALSEESDFELDPTEGGADRGERYSLVADLSFGVAAASAVTAFILWLRREQEAEPRGEDTAQLRLMSAPAGVGLGAELEF